MCVFAIIVRRYVSLVVDFVVDAVTDRGKNNIIRTAVALDQGIRRRIDATL